jgi:hypothetical protein
MPGRGPSKQLSRGELDVELHGTKLCRGFTLVPVRKAFGRSCPQEQGLLIAPRDTAPIRRSGAISAQLVFGLSRAGSRLTPKDLAS